MPIIGANQTSTYVQYTRDQFITMAHKVIGVIEPGQVLSGDELEDGKMLLSFRVRELDQSGKWRWTIEEAKHVPLTSLTYIYNVDRGLPGNIAELLTANYRDSSGNDYPVSILRAEAFESIQDKFLVGDPTAIYLTDNVDLSLRTLHTYPSPQSVATQSVIAGPFRCIRTHVADLTNEPLTGQNWQMYWEDGGEGGAAWVQGTSYTAPAAIRLLYRRPVIDFSNSDSTPDFPLPWPRLLLYALADDLGDLYGIPLDERNRLIEKAQGAKNSIFPSTKTKTNFIHNKAKYF